MKPITEIDVFKNTIPLMETKLARKLTLAKNELRFLYKERGSLTEELILAKQNLTFQYEEKERQTAELVFAHVELAFQNKEKDKRASELILANKELIFQNEEIDKKAIELVIITKELDFKKLEKNIRALELNIAKKKLFFKSQEKQIETAILNIANRELKEAEDTQNEYIKGLEELMFMTSHRVRQPIANILGFTDMLDQSICSPDDFKQSIACLKKSAITLDVFTRELTALISELVQKGKKDRY